MCSRRQGTGQSSSGLCSRCSFPQLRGCNWVQHLWLGPRAAGNYRRRFPGSVNNITAMIFCGQNRAQKSHSLYPRQDNAEFLRRVRMYTLGDTKIWKPVDRVRYGKYWKDQHDELGAAVDEAGLDVLGEEDSAATDSWKTSATRSATSSRCSRISCSREASTTSRPTASTTLRRRAQPWPHLKP